MIIIIIIIIIIVTFFKSWSTKIALMARTNKDQLFTKAKEITVHQVSNVVK